MREFVCVSSYAQVCLYLAIAHSSLPSLSGDAMKLLKGKLGDLTPVSCAPLPPLALHTLLALVTSHEVLLPPCLYPIRCVCCPSPFRCAAPEPEPHGIDVYTCPLFCIPVSSQSLVWMHSSCSLSLSLTFSHTQSSRLSLVSPCAQAFSPPSVQTQWLRALKAVHPASPSSLFLSPPLTGRPLAVDLARTDARAAADAARGPQTPCARAFVFVCLSVCFFLFWRVRNMPQTCFIAASEPYGFAMCSNTHTHTFACAAIRECVELSSAIIDMGYSTTGNSTAFRETLSLLGYTGGAGGKKVPASAMGALFVAMGATQEGLPDFVVPLLTEK